MEDLMRLRILCVLACALVAWVVVAPPLPAQTLDIREWPVEWEGRPRDPDIDQSGRVWFVGQTGNYIGMFDPTNESFRRFALEPDTRPHNLIVAADGGVWYAGNGNARIGRLDPATGSVRTYAMPDDAARDPHTLVFDSRGNIWFTVQGGGFIGRLDTTSGGIELLQTEAGTRPYGIAIDSRGHAWVNLFGTNRLAAIDPESFTAREIATPRAEARTRRVAISSDDAVWYTDFAAGMIGRFDATNGEIREWPAPGGAQSQPYALVADAQDRIWFSECARDAAHLVALDPATGRFVHRTPVSACIRHMVYHPSTGSIWFGTDAHNIGRARLP
jgi:virginiamycin B lyase